MKLCTFEVRTHVGRQRRLGAMVTEGILDLNFACAAMLGNDYTLANALVPPDLLGLLRRGKRSMRTAADAVNDCMVTRGSRDETVMYRPEQIRMLAPLPCPPSVRDFYAFEDHVKKGFEKRGEALPHEWYEMPVYYKSASHHIIGTEEDATWPSFTDKFDYELELAAVIGKKGANIAAANARPYIAGFTIMNDFSARDIQRREMKVRLGPAKGKDWCTAMGPWLVTTDEIGDPYNLEMTARVNGEIWSQGNSRSMYWKFEQMIEFLTENDTIYPGDVIGSGTVGGGCGLELDRWVKRGDVIELEIEKIGVLRNRVV